MPYFDNIRLENNQEHIIKGCIANETHHQEALYKQMYEPMMKVCWRYALDMDHAASLYNQSMLKVLLKIKQYGFKGSFEGWVKRIVINTCIDDCRKKNKFKELYLDEVKNINEYVEPSIYSELQVDEIMQLVHQLPKNTGLVFNLYVLDGYKHNEIGQLLGISEGTSKWHLNEARRMLKHALENIEYKHQQSFIK